MPTLHQGEENSTEDDDLTREEQQEKAQQFVEEQDVFPNLERVQSTALHPGEDHRIFWYTVRPVDDPFWTHHRPGDRWNCQCDLRQTDLPPTDIPTVPINDTKNSPAPGLDNNPGTDGQIFNDRHPYFPKNCTACTFANMGKKLMYLAGWTTDDCNECNAIANAITQEDRQQQQDRTALREAGRTIYRKIKEEIGLRTKIESNELITGTLQLTKDSVKSTLNTYHHSRTEESKDAILFSLKNINNLSFEHKEEVGEGKDMNNPVEYENVQRKLLRNVVGYNIYTFNYNDKLWALGLEHIKKNNNEYEQLYFIAER